jgi:hypothetical protein
METTIGQRILAAVMAHKLGIATDRAFKLYVKGHEIDPSWEVAGNLLLERAPASIGKSIPRGRRRLAPSIRRPRSSTPA